ncbi:MAG TPA: amino acid ABC transporter permease [Gaiellaceae bacterium]|nr:amino acid ABC transporter permease [Gaiellaceae bacterium]
MIGVLPDWAGPVAHYMIHDGLKETLRIAAFAVVGSTAVGILLGTLMTIRFWPSRALIRLYVEVFRGLPIIVTLFLVYYALPGAPLIHHRFAAFTGAAIGLTLWGSAQVAEATRGAVQSIPREQHEAAAALGFGWIGRHRSVILPQALRRLLPPLVSLLANVIQNTTIASLIGVTELLATGQRSVERLQFTSPESHAFAIYGAIMAGFFLISFPLTRLAIFLERRMV